MYDAIRPPPGQLGWEDSFRMSLGYPLIAKAPQTRAIHSSASQFSIPPTRPSGFLNRSEVGCSKGGRKGTFGQPHEQAIPICLNDLTLPIPKFRTGGLTIASIVAEWRFREVQKFVLTSHTWWGSLSVSLGRYCSGHSHSRRAPHEELRSGVTSRAARRAHQHGSAAFGVWGWRIARSASLDYGSNRRKPGPIPTTRNSSLIPSQRLDGPEGSGE